MGFDFKDKKIDLNKLASDIIVFSDKGFVNKMTGKSGRDLEDVIRDRKFVAVNEQYFNNKELLGYCGLYDRQTESFYFLSCCYKEGTGWEETMRCCLYKTGGKVYVFKDSTMLFYRAGYFDIGGQAAVYVRSGKLSLWGIRSDTDVDVLSLDSSYIGEAMAFLQDFDLPENELSSISRLYIPRYIDVILETFDKVICFPVPGFADTHAPKYDIKEDKEALTMADNYLRLKVIGKLSEGFPYTQHVKFPVLKNMGGELYIYEFIAVIEPSCPISQLKFHYRGRHAKKLDLEACETLGREMFYVDRLDGTILQYAAGPVYKWQETKRGICVESGKDAFAMLPLLNKAKQNFLCEHGFSITDIFKVCAVIAENPVLEKLYKLKNSGILQRSLGENISLGIITGDDCLCRIFCGLEEGNSLHDIIGIPKGMLEYAMESPNCLFNMKVIGKIKCLFNNTGGKEYLLRMNKEDFTMLFDFVSKALDEAPDLYTSFANLFFIRGYKNWKRYICFLSFDGKTRFQKAKQAFSYRKYTDILLSLGDAAKDADWKLMDEALEKALKSFEKICVKKKDVLVNKQLETQYPVLEKLAYKGKKYAVTYPKTADDIIEEGIILHHCAANFIEAAATGGSQLLFIRDVENMDVPFYTLEIRNGMVRQCHGFDNKKTTPEVEDFLVEYCREKHISYKDTDKCLGV